MNKNILKDLETVKQVFDHYGVKLILVYGALLGQYRDKDFLPGDDDIDLAVIDKIDLQKRKAIGWSLYDLGFRPQQVAFNVFGRMEPQEIGYNGDGETGVIVCERFFKFTIFFFKEEECNIHGTEYVCTPKLGSVKLIASPKKYYDKLGEIKIGKVKLATPYPIADYLDFSYDDWKDKDKRDHSPTYFVAHNTTPEFIDIEGKNEVLIFK